MDVAPTVSVAGTRTARKLSRGKLLSRRWSLTVEFDRLRTFPTGRIMRPKEEAIEVGARLAAAWRGPLIMPRSCKISGDAMKRRDFIWLLGTSAIWATESGAQQPLRTIALIGNTPAAFGPWQAALVERLGQLGWIAGRTLQVEYRWSEGRRERVVEIAAELVSKKVDLITTYGGAAVVMKQATASIPIVFVPA